MDNTLRFNFLILLKEINLLAFLLVALILIKLNCAFIRKTKLIYLQLR